jgi:hypothetical protein
MDTCEGMRTRLSLSRLNHWLPRGQAHPEVVQGTAEFHHEIAVVRNNRIAVPPAGGCVDRPYNMQDKAPLDNKAPSSDNSQE